MRYIFILFLFIGSASVSQAQTYLNCTEITVEARDYTHVSKNLPTRNNNPGNIRRTSVKYFGETNADATYESFSSPIWGYAAMFDLLYRLYSGLTLKEAIYKWAPPTENDSERYVRFVSGEVGVDADEYIIDVDNPSIMTVAKYMSVLEGMKGFSDSDIELGYMLWDSCYYG